MSEAKFSKLIVDLAVVQSNMSIIDEDRRRVLGAIGGLKIAEEMYEENEARARLLGKIYVALQQGDEIEAYDLLNEAETIDFSSGEPVAVSPSLAKARGES